MTVKDLMKRLAQFPEDTMILTGDYIKETNSMGWDNIELLKFKDDLYIVSSGVVEFLYTDELSDKVVGI